MFLTFMSYENSQASPGYTLIFSIEWIKIKTLNTDRSIISIFEPCFAYTKNKKGERLEKMWKCQSHLRHPGAKLYTREKVPRSMDAMGKMVGFRYLSCHGAMNSHIGYRSLPPIPGYYQFGVLCCRLQFRHWFFCVRSPSSCQC